MRCTTQSGPFRCNIELDANGKHAGECETTAPASPSGPARDTARASLHLRPILDAAVGRELDAIGARLDVRRHATEGDHVYRERIWGGR